MDMLSTNQREDEGHEGHEGDDIYVSDASSSVPFWQTAKEWQIGDVIVTHWWQLIAVAHQ